MAQNKNIFKRFVNKIVNTRQSLEHKTLEHALSYIDQYWSVITMSSKLDHGAVIGLPNAYVVPASDDSASFTFQEQYYWDSFFISLGLVDSKHHKLAEGMLDNLIYLFKRFGFIPNASRMYYMSRSQPPMLTSFIRLIYETSGKDKVWLRERMSVAQDEYEKVWMSSSHPFWHKVHHGLSRYYDINVLHDLAEAESGWDMTPRFERKCMDYLPVDLNSLLYKYETDFVWYSMLIEDTKAVRFWQRKSASRKLQMTKCMWHQRKGFFFDYKYSKDQKGDIWSLAGFYPLWAGLATPEQASLMVANLYKFEMRGGLATTNRQLIDTSQLFGSLPTQWAFPNGWAPLQWIVIKGLENYGYYEEASRIANKWLRTNLEWFHKHKEFLEKYNVVSPHKSPVEGLYPSQSGFGWTNGVFVALSKEYELK